MSEPADPVTDPGVPPTSEERLASLVRQLEGLQLPQLIERLGKVIALWGQEQEWKAQDRSALKAAAETAAADAKDRRKQFFAFLQDQWFRLFVATVVGILALVYGFSDPAGIPALFESAPDVLP